MNRIKRMIKLTVLACLLTAIFSYVGFKVGQTAIEFMSGVELYFKTLPEDK